MEVAYVSTERNLPAREFLSSLGDHYRNHAAGQSWLFPAEYLAGLKYSPDEKSRQSNDKREMPIEDKPAPSPAFGFGMTTRSEHLQRIGEELYDISRVTKAVEEFRLETKGVETISQTEPFDGVEAAVANIWRRVLGRPEVGLNVNFFEVGGTSLKAVQVIAMIRKEMKQNLSIISLFECPTVKLLAARLSGTVGSPSREASTTGAALRGQQRRSRAMRRTRTQ